MGQQVNSFQPIGLSLPIVAMYDVYSAAPLDFTIQIPKVLGPRKSKEHSEILT